ncbi:MAG: hypothetical protein HC799_16225 [Limnothrix sp. RL_2_0]|nr:hypothetical protein [Limnothrix sp. RL_2_0]
MHEFIELYTDFEDLEGLPVWMQELWEDAYYLHDGGLLWTDDEGVVEISRIVDEFRTSTHGYIRAGIIAHNVRFRRLYQACAKSFTAFCSKFLGQSVWMVNRTIAAAQVAIKLMASGFNQIPANEAQCRPLARLNEDDLIEVWRTVCRSIPETDRTAAAICGVIARFHEVDPDFEAKPQARRIELTAAQWDKLTEKAGRYGMSPKKYLDLLLEKDLADEPEPPPPPQPKPKAKRKRKSHRWAIAKNLGGIVDEWRSPAPIIPHPT